MITKKQSEIISLFKGSIQKELTTTEIMTLQNTSSKSHISGSLKALEGMNLIKKSKKANTYFYSLNTDEPSLYPYLGAIFWETLPKEAQRSIRILKQNLDKYTINYSLVVFGSHAKGTPKKSSDLDIAIITEDRSRESEIKTASKDAELKSLKKLDIHIIDKQEFLEMLNADFENLGKEIARSNCTLVNIEYFYSILRKGIKNGFKP